MSGTSLDGVDAALIETDGYSFVNPLGFITREYSDGQREAIRAAFGQREYDDACAAAEAVVTQAHIDVLKEAGWEADVIGFHGQTIFHAPDEGLSIQLGDGAAMAVELGIPVVNDFRTADVKAGGQGAPLAPLYHQARALSSEVDTPCAILNIGGVANVTWIGGAADEILAFDTGAGNALMDDWMQERWGKAYDEDGALASKGVALEEMLEEWLGHDYFVMEPPKSLDRNEWDISDFGYLSDDMGGISDEDGAATLLEFTARSIIASQRFMKEAPLAWYVCGGGRHNKALMARLSRDLNVQPVEALNWNGDATEGECFAYLAVRSLLKLPLSLPSTTGVAEPISGGVLHSS